jgi:hypothetical protein
VLNQLNTIKRFLDVQVKFVPVKDNWLLKIMEIFDLHGVKLVLKARIAIFHSGHPRDSSKVNSIWEESLKTQEGYSLHSKKLAVAYRFREGLRLKKWDHVYESIEEYRKICVNLCSDYMKGSNEIWQEAKNHNCTIFPLGAGGGGTVFLFFRR